MSKSIIKSSIFFLIIIFAVFNNIDLNAQKALKAKERIKEIKKVKLLNILNLDEQSADKFLAKYSALQKNIDDKKEMMNQTIDDLQMSLKSKAKKDDIVNKTQKVLQAQKEFQNSIDESFQSIKGILSEENFAKYLVFENNFKRELQKIMYERSRGHFK